MEIDLVKVSTSPIEARGGSPDRGKASETETAPISVVRRTTRKSSYPTVACAEGLAGPTSSLQGLWVYNNMPGLCIRGGQCQG